LLVLVPAVAEATKPVERDGPREAVTRLALVELAGHETAQRRVVEPSQGEQGPLNKADLAEGGSDAELLPVPWTPR
jgi:hypothetical protein